MEILFYSSEDDSFGAFSILFFLLFKFSFSLFVTPPPPHPPKPPLMISYLWCCSAKENSKSLDSVYCIN